LFKIRRRHKKISRDWSSDVCSSDLGIPHTETENLITSNFYHENQTEIRKSIKSAYQNNSAEFGKFANLAGSQKKEIINDTTPDYLKSTPTIPIEAINLMPDLFREGARRSEEHTSE